MSEPIRAIKCNSYEEVCEKRVGAFCFARNYTVMFVWLPNDTMPSTIRINVPDEPGKPAWALSGSEDKPTLRPSIDAPGIWHGYLTEGMFHL